MIPSIDDIFTLHDAVIKESGGRFGVRDFTLIESAYYSAFQGFGDLEFYPSESDKIVRIGWGLASNHGFIDGNKRVGIAFISYAFENLTDFSFTFSDEECESEMLKVAESKESYEDFRDWIYDRLTI